MTAFAASATMATVSALVFGEEARAMTDNSIRALPVTPVSTPVVRPNAEQWDMTSGITGRDYRIFISKPSGGGAPPPDGYPVIYLNDGDFEFHSAADGLALQTMMREARPAYLVGIGYGRDWEYLSRSRFADLTPSPPDTETLTRLAASPMMNGAVFGQADSFHRFLLEELRPLIEARYPVDHRDATLFGHSLGGLFALHVLFNYPESYRTFLVNSPSINWSGGAVLLDESNLVAKLNGGTVAPRILLTAGEFEEKLAEHVQPPPGVTREQMEAHLKAFGMVTNVIGLADRLSAVESSKGLEIQTTIFSGETHASVVLPAISRGIRFAVPV